MGDLIGKMEPYLKALADNKYLGVAGVVLSALSLVYALYAHRQSKKSSRYKLLRCDVSSINVIRNKATLFPRLDVKFDGRDLDDLTSTSLAFRNDGTDVLRWSDIAPSDRSRYLLPRIQTPSSWTRI